MSEDNPYSAPQAPLHPEKFSKSEIWQVLGTGIVLGSVLGAGTNALNGWIGPTYFAFVFKSDRDLWLKAVIQGVFEAGLYGLLNAAIFELLANFWGRGIRSVAIVRKYLLGCAAAVLGFWLLGGVGGLLFARWLGRHPLYRGPFPAPLFDDTGFCWTAGSLNVAVGMSWIITLIAGYHYSQKRLTLPVDDERS
jgi:hypothetical protein